MRETRYRVIFLTIALLPALAVHVPALQFLLVRREIALLSERRFVDSAIFVSTSAAAVVATWFLAGRKHTWVLLLFQAMLAALAGVPVHGTMRMELLLLGAMVLGAGVSYTFPRSLWVMLAGAATCLLISSTGGSLPSKLRVDALGGTAGLATVLVATAGLAILVHSLIDRFDESQRELDLVHDALAKLSDANVQYQDYATHVAEVSSGRERRRITRDLHDVVGLAFTNIIGMMNAVIKSPLASTEEQQELFEWVRETSQTGLKNTRTILYELRNISEPRLSTIELVLRVVNAFRTSTGTEVRVEWGNLSFTLPPAHNTAIIHLVQEALVNSFRHGKSTFVEIHFKVIAGVIRVRISDNGYGGPTDQYGIGQSGIRERLKEVEGTVRFGTSPTGYQVDAAIPVAGVRE